VSGRSTSAPCSIKIRDISGVLLEATNKGVAPSYPKNNQLKRDHEIHLTSS